MSLQSDWVETTMYKIANAVVDLGANPRLIPAFLSFATNSAEGSENKKLVQELPNAVHWR